MQLAWYELYREMTIRPQTSCVTFFIFLGHKTGSYLCSSLWAVWRPSEISRPHWQRSSKDHARLSISHRSVCIRQSWWTKRACARCHTNGLQTKLVIGVCRSIYHTRLSLVNGPIINQNQPIVLLHCRFNILSVQAQMIPHDHCLKIFSLFYQRSSGFKHKRSFPFSVNSLPSVSNVGIRLVGFKQNCALFFHSVLVAESC